MAARLPADRARNANIDDLSDLYIYTFSANANDHVILQIGTTSSLEDVQIDLYASNGTRVRASAGFSKGVIDQSIPTTGTYAVVARSYGESTGGVPAHLFAKMPATQAADANGDGGTISSGQTRSANINDLSDLDIYSFSANANDHVNLQIGTTSSLEDVEIDLYGPDGTKVAGGSGFSKGVIDTSLSGTGTYLIVTRSYGDSTGAYKLSFAKVPATQSPDPDGDGGSISSGPLRNATINDLSDLDIYTFSANANDHINLENGKHLVRLKMYSSNCTVPTATSWPKARVSAKPLLRHRCRARARIQLLPAATAVRPARTPIAFRRDGPRESSRRPRRPDQRSQISAAGRGCCFNH